ncbi:hypothetical protein D3C86_1719680 [compost metagenome]
MTYFVRAVLAIVWWIISIGWLLGTQPAATLPWWLIVVGHFLLVIAFRQRPGESMREPSQTGQVLDNVAVTLCIVASVIFALTSGFAIEGTFTLNIWAKFSALLFCAGISCMFAAAAIDRVRIRR